MAFPTSKDRQIERQAQADAIKQIALDQLKDGYSLVVWGDFNDYDVEDEGLDVNHHKPISSVPANIRLVDRNTEVDDLVKVECYIK